MPFTLRAVSLAKLLREALAVYRSHFFLFLGISAVPSLLLLMLQLALERVPAGRPHHPETLGLLAALGIWLASLFSSSITTAATTIAVSDIYTDRLPDMWESFARLTGKAWRIVLAALLVEIYVSLGALFLLVPGIYFAGIYGLTIPVVALENLGPKKAMDRSEHLSKDSAGRIILVYFLTAVLTGILVAMLNAGADYLGWASPSYHGILSKHLLNLVTAAIGGIVFGPISAIALALEYYDLRSRFEGFDLHQLRALMMTPDALPAKTYADVNS